MLSLTLSRYGELCCHAMEVMKQALTSHCVYKGSRSISRGGHVSGTSQVPNKGEESGAEHQEGSFSKPLGAQGHQGQIPD